MHIYDETYEKIIWKCRNGSKILCKLPTTIGRGSNIKKECLDYKSIVNFIFDVEYLGNVYNNLEVIRCTNKCGNYELEIKYKNKNTVIKSSHFSNGSFGKILGTITSNFKIPIETTFKENKRNLTIMDREYRKDIHTGQNKKWYKYKCNICGWDEGWIEEHHLLNYRGCACCRRNKIVLGINTIWDTDRWMCNLGVSEEDAKKYTKGSKTKIEVTCPYCGYKKTTAINNIYNKKSIGCSCGDGFSYPEKFMFNVLRQLNTEFKIQLNKTTFKWCGEYKYDFYLPSIKAIIETNGKQHYENTTSFKNSLQHQREIDELKEKLAKENGINNYITIDCSKSDMGFIKQHIMNSKLNELFDLSNIDWLKADEYSIMSNKVKEVCDYWNNKEEYETTQSIANNNKWGIKSKCGIRSYLKKGNKLGWCNYNPKEENKKSCSRMGKLNKKSVEVFNNGKYLGTFNSYSELEIQSEELFGVKFSRYVISKICNGNRQQYKGYTFKHRPGQHS